MPRPRRQTLRLLSTLLLVGCWVGMFLATHWPHPPPVTQKVWDKLLHFSAYAGLTLLLLFTRRLAAPLNWGAYGGISLLLAGYAAVDEISQPAVGRTADVRDWLADILGVLAACVVFFVASSLWTIWRRKRAAARAARASQESRTSD